VISWRKKILEDTAREVYGHLRLQFSKIIIGGAREGLDIAWQ